MMSHLFLFLTASASSLCFGFAAPIHGEITKSGFELANRCRLINPARVSAAYEVIQGSIEEDTTQPWFRMRNWHFYNTYGNLHQGPFIYESLDHAFRIRSQQLDETRSLNSLGRVLHYIQDMFVPAHVVPVFHGGPTSKGDEFDHYVISAAEKQQAVDTITCDSLNADIAVIRLGQTSHGYDTEESNRDILDRAAHYTLAKVNSPIGRTLNLWNQYWQAPSTTDPVYLDTPAALVALGFISKRFGMYVGIFGQHAVSGNQIYTTDDDFKQFYINLYQEAIKASAKFLILN